MAFFAEVLRFDYRAGWDLIEFSFPDSLDCFFEVFIEPAGGGIPLGGSLILTAPGGTDTSGGPNSDTGPLSGTIDLSPFAGTDARVNFVWSVPGDFTGPGNRAPCLEFGKCRTLKHSNFGGNALTPELFAMNQS